MLDISFYSQDKEEVELVEIVEDLYLWLAQSEFSKIGKSEEKEMKIDGEKEKVSVILLEGDNRRKFSNFFRDAIVKESDEMLSKLGNSLGNSPSKEGYADATLVLKTLQNLRKCIENEKHKYLRRL